METRKLGRFDVSLVGLGTNNFGMRCDEQQTAQVVNAALEAGINLFDTADIYGGGLSEEYLGKALGSRRDDVVIATKFGAPTGDDPDLRGGNPKWVPMAAENSLRRLGTDRIDLYQMHFPDDETPIEDTLEALKGLVEQGKVLEIGCSNFGAERMDASIQISEKNGWARWVTVQNHWNLLNRDTEASDLDACKRHGVAMLPYFPLASGMLTGKYRRGEQPKEGTRLAGAAADRVSQIMSDHNFDVVEALEKFAADRGRTLLELAISWLANHDVVASVIAGATKPDQVKANAQAASWKMTPEEIEEIERIAG